MHGKIVPLEILNFTLNLDQLVPGGEGPVAAVSS